MSQSSPLSIEISATHVNECVPLLPEITIGNHTDRIAQLVLDARWYRDHQANEFPFDGNDFFLR